LMLGPQWREAVPLIQIYSMAMLFSFPNALSYPTLVASGAIRHTTPLAFIQMLVTLLVAGIMGRYGLRHVALGMFISIPCGVGFSVYLVRAHLGFTWLEFFIAVRKSVVCALLSGAGPLLVSLNYRWSADISLQSAVIAVGLSGIGWIGGLWLTDHPLLREFGRVKNVMSRCLVGVKLAGWMRSN
jgi:O-antigen/teichoic acid export membrane protein